MIKCILLEAGTVRDLAKALEAFASEHGDLPLLFEDDYSQSPTGNICIYAADDDHGLDEDEAPFMRAVISS